MRYFLVFCIMCFWVDSYAKKTTLFQTQYDPKTVLRNYSRAEVMADIDFMIKITQDVHPNFYYHFTKKQLSHWLDSLKTTLPDSVSIYEAALAISTIEAKFNEGHLGLVMNKASVNNFQLNVRKFPYSVWSVENDVLLVKKDLTQQTQLSFCDTIVTINGIDAASLIRRFKNYYGGLPCWENGLIASNFDYLLYSIGVRAPYVVEALHNGAKLKIDSQSIIKGSRDKKRHKNACYDYSVINNDIAVINFHSMGAENLEMFTDSIKITFTDIYNRGISKLIIDLRENGGGSTDLGDVLLSYINNKPYRLAASFIVHYRPVLNDCVPMSLACKLLAKFPGGYYQTNARPVSAPKTSEPFFWGKTCVLIGHKTFSSANMLTDAISSFNLSTLIGESTCEPCNDYGDMVPFELPNTRLIALTPYKVFTKANGDFKDFGGIKPNIEIVPTSATIKAGRDTVLNYAIDWLRTNK